MGVTIGLARRAPLTLLDEVHLGMDAPSRYTFYDELLKDFLSHPQAIILSSHLIGEIERLLDHVVVLNEGKILDTAPIEDFQTKGHAFTGPKNLIAQLEELAHQINAQVVSSQHLGGTRQITIIGSSDKIIKSAQAAGITEIEPISLQDLFVHLTSAEKGK